MEDGTVSSYSVLAFLATKQVREKLLAQVKTCMHRCTNKVLFCSTAGHLHKWVREGDSRLRLKFLRDLCDKGEVDLTDYPDEPLKDTKTLTDEMAYEVVQALVLYAAGRGSNGRNKYGFYPYGREQSFSTKAFKKLPSTWFATTLAEMYPFVAMEKESWKDLRKKRAMPMTGLWFLGVMRRHMCFQKRFDDNRIDLFAKYEALEGEYHGPEPVQYETIQLSDDNSVVDMTDDVDVDFV